MLPSDDNGIVLSLFLHSPNKKREGEKAKGDFLWLNPKSLLNIHLNSNSKIKSLLSFLSFLSN